jgi:hypothetical protein
MSTRDLTTFGGGIVTEYPAKPKPTPDLGLLEQEGKFHEHFEKNVKPWLQSLRKPGSESSRPKWSDDEIDD